MRALLTVSMLILAFAASAAEYKWAGMRNPCKLSAEDGLNEKQLGKKIGTFIALRDNDEWNAAIFNVSAKFPTAKPWATWAVGELKDATALPDDVHEAYLTDLDARGVQIYIEVWPSGKDVNQLIDTYLAKFKHHSCVAGFSVDLEYHKPKLDDATAKMWDERIKAVSPKYRLMLKHWEIARMPPTYRGKGDLIFVDDSSEASMEELNEGFAKWADHFAPSAVAFQIGYPADEDGMDGKRTSGWSTLKDPIKEWGDALLAKMKNPNQEVGLIWVCARSGKSYNQGWDLTKKP